MKRLFKLESKYQFPERNDGFSIHAKDRVSVHVTLTDFGFRLHFGDSLRQLALFDDIPPRYPRGSERGSQEFTNLVQYPRLVKLISKGLMSEWTPPAGRTGPYRVRRWVIDRTRQAIGKRVYQQWERLRAKASPVVLGVQKAVFAATFGDNELLYEPALYSSEHIAGDIRAYRSAAALPAILRLLVSRQRGNPVESEVPVEDQIESLNNWMSLYSHSGETYRSLRRTLMNLPGGIPADLLQYLTTIRLQRPVQDRLELLTLLLSRSMARYPAVPEAGNSDQLFLHASRSQILSAMTRVSRYLGDKLSPRRTADVSRFVQVLVDYPEAHHGNIGGLARKSIRWHQDLQRREIRARSQHLGLETTTASPPLPVPKVPGIRFLATVEDVCAEAEQMHHCIDSYAESAVEGHSYLFHFEHMDESASVEVDWSGRVRQSQGPSNSQNRAARVGRQLLQEWGSRFPKQTTPVVENRDFDNCPNGIPF